MDFCEIKVYPVSSYDADASTPQDSCYVFNYTITLENTGDVPATLRSRHWFITDADGKITEVEGDGVVGEFPTLQPKQKYTYQSQSVIPTPFGTMHGYFHMITDEGHSYTTDIPVFSLSNLTWLH